MTTLMEALRQTTKVDCDTLDCDVAKDLGPFVDCTSNQAIAYFELSRPVVGKTLLHHEALIKEAIQDARGKLQGIQGSATFEEFVVEILMVKLQLLIIPNVTGYVHIQTNPKFSYAAGTTVDNAERLIEIFETLAPDLDSTRVCIKVPATWEGMKACRILQDTGVSTLATTMFCMEQAALAAHAHCTYIAPYVNELKVHFEAGYVDENKAFDFCREAQAYYLAHAHETQVLAASLTSVDDVMRLAGIQHITISPSLLRQLSDVDVSTWDGKLGEYFEQGPDHKSWETQDYPKLVKDEAAWKLAFTRSGFGVAEGKIIQAINYFADFQEKLEELVKQHVE
ncbi:Fc.00g054380.m01.CDS01 [Cosmosporella sp. VM-42]